MHPYTLSEEDRRALAPFHRQFHAALALRAAERLGLPYTAPRGIFKYEGGVRLGALEIAIYSSCVNEDWRRERRTLPEEIAVAESIEALAQEFRSRGPTLFEPYRAAVDLRGDPLRSLFGRYLPEH